MFKKLLVVLLVVCLATMTFSGCGKKTGDDPNEQVTLKWIFGGPGELEDSERVWEEFNKQLAEYIPNTKVEFEVIPHADYAERWKLMNAAQEDMDIVWVSWALNFKEEVSKGALLDITELVDEYGQDMKSEFPDWLLQLTSVDGKIYSIPNYQMMASPVGFSIEKHHADEGWLDIKAVEEMFTSGKVLSIEDYRMFEPYFEKVLSSGEKVKYVSTQFLDRAIKEKIGMPYGGVEPIVCNAVIERKGNDYKVYDALTDFPDSYEYYDLVHDWYKKGYIRSDILANPTEDAKDYLLWWTSMFKGSAERATITIGRPMEVFMADPQLYIGYNGVSTSTAISSNSKHPERAMQVINLLNSKKGAKLLNLLTYGFEGEHYTKLTEDRIEWLGEATPGSSKNKYGYQNWAIGNALVTYTTQADPDGWNEYLHNDINMKADMSRLAGFSLDTKPIKLEIAQYNATLAEYAYLDKGTTPNYKELLKERNEKLKAAGSEKIVKEVQRQVNEWVKTKK